MLIPTFIGLTLLTFILLQLLPGDPISVMIGDKPVSDLELARLKALYGADLPLYKQYFNYVWNLVQGDFGRSYVTLQPVLTEFFTRFPATVQLGLTAALLSISLGIPLGIIAALNRGKFLDNLIMTISLTGYSMPIFWWGFLLIMLFSVNLNWLPVSGTISIRYFIEDITYFPIIDAWLSGEPGAFVSALKHLVLPAIVLSTIPLALISRITRSAMTEVMNEDYIRVAKSKGLSYSRVVLVHGLRNSLISVITVIGLIVGGLFSGAILTETVFSWPGIGKWLVDSINNRDYPVVQGAVLLIAVVVVVVNLIVDLLYGVLSPTIRKES